MNKVLILLVIIGVSQTTNAGFAILGQGLTSSISGLVNNAAQNIAIVVNATTNAISQIVNSTAAIATGVTSLAAQAINNAVEIKGDNLANKLSIIGNITIGVGNLTDSILNATVWHFEGIHNKTLTKLNATAYVVQSLLNSSLQVHESVIAGLLNLKVTVINGTATAATGILGSSIGVINSAIVGVAGVIGALGSTVANVVTAISGSLVNLSNSFVTKIQLIINSTANITDLLLTQHVSIVNDLLQIISSSATVGIFDLKLNLTRSLLNLTSEIKIDVANKTASLLGIVGNITNILLHHKNHSSYANCSDTYLPLIANLTNDKLAALAACAENKTSSITDFGNSVGVFASSISTTITDALASITNAFSLSSTVTDLNSKLNASLALILVSFLYNISCC